MGRVTLALLMLLSSTVAEAQSPSEFAPFSLIENPQVVVLNGSIDARTPLIFRRLLAARPQANVLVLNSPGGDVQAALLVAEDVFARKMSTLILEGSGCYSACALVYFAGSERVAEGELGVHQISGSSDIQSTQLNLSDVIEYLSKYGVPAEVITRMLRTPPADMYVFSQAEIASLGINRLGASDTTGNTAARGPMATPQAKPSASPTEPTSPSAKPEDLAQAFVLGVIMSGSLPKEDLLATARNFYSNSVTFYGKLLSQSEVLADKAKYADRWPSRAAAARAPTIRSFCNGNICRVTGLYDWSVADPRRKASAKGSAEFEYVIDMSDGYKVIAENGKVLTRN